LRTQCTNGCARCEGRTYLTCPDRLSICAEAVERSPGATLPTDHRFILAISALWLPPYLCLAGKRGLKISIRLLRGTSARWYDDPLLTR